MNTATVVAIVAALSGILLVFQDSGLLASFTGLFKSSEKKDSHGIEEMLNLYLGCEADRTPEKDAKVRAGLDVLIEHCIQHDINERHPGLPE